MPNVARTRGWNALEAARRLAAACALLACASRPGAAADPTFDAPSTNSASFGVIDRPGFPARAGIGVQGVLDPGIDRTAYTLVATPLAFLRPADGDPRPDAPSDASGWMRRVAARLTVGGPLQQVDPHHARRAARLTNHTTTEVQVKLADGGAHGAGARPVSLTAALVADNLATGYGLDRYGGTLIAEREGPAALTANAGFDVTERYKSPVRYEQARLGAGATLRLPQPRGAHGSMDAGFGVGCLVRNQRRPSVWQGSARFDAPLVRGLRLSVSGRASNRSETRGIDRLRGVVGLSRAIG